MDWNSEFTQMQVLNDMILIQQFIFDKYKNESLSQGGNFNVNDDFPSLDSTLKEKKKKKRWKSR